MQRSSIVETVYDGIPERGRWQAEPAAGTSEIGDLWRILWGRRRMVLAVATACILAALLYVSLTPAQFTSTAQVLIDPRDRQIVSKDVNPDTLASDGGILQVESQARVIESDAVLLRAIRSLHLGDDPDYGARKDGPLTWFVGLLRGIHEPTGALADEERALRALRRRLAVKRADKVFVIDIVVTASSGARAAKIADAIAEAYLADQVQSRSDSTTRASDALSSHLDELRKSVKAAADTVERYKASHDLLGTDKQSISDQQLSENGSQLNTARARVSELQARTDQLDALRGTGSDGGAMQEALQSSVITQLRAALADLTRRQSDMRTRYGDRYPDLIAIEAEIRQARASIATELDRVVRSAHADLDRAKKNERALSSAQGALKQQTISNDQAFVTLEELVRELNARRSVYNAFLARAGETREQSNIDNTNSRIISRAIQPIQPSWPLGAVLLLGAAGLGLGIGSAVAFLLEYLAPTVLSSAQLQAAARAPVIGTLSGAGRWRSRAFRAGAVRGGRADPALGLALSRLCGPFAALRQRSKPYTVLVTSARGLTRTQLALGEGFAAAAAGGEASVLLVEADPLRAHRDPTARGFLDVLNGACTLRETMIQGTDTRIYRLRIGTAAADGAEVLGESRLRQFLKMVERKFDIVVFLGGSFGETLRAAPLAACVDDVLFVAVRGTTSQTQVSEVAEAVAVSAGRPVSAALLVDHAVLV